MSNPFREAIHGVSVQLATILHVSDLLLTDLTDKEVITSIQRDEIRVRSSFVVFSTYYYRTHCIIRRVINSFMIKNVNH